ncbi:MAG: murein biosynthesis integral membrane protein MurJ [Candidatus Cloacimonadota bacterium]|nr:MAG: murein biosynthesis integral membrane protein MurJ [Candidatus Cloacimonadota bacterium]
MTQEKRQSFKRKVGGFGFGTAISRVLGLVREMTFSYLFGAGMMMDAYRIAFNIPNLLRDLFSEGSLSAAFLPIFSDYEKKRGKKDAFRFTGYVFNVLLLFIGALVAIGMVFSPQIVHTIAYGFTKDPEKFALTIQLTRIIFPFVAFMVVSALAMGVLNYYNHFFTTGFAPALFNIGIIGCGFIISPFLIEKGIPPILSIGIGVLVGALLQLLIQIPYFIKSGFRLVRRINFREKGLLRLLKIMIPIEFSYAVTRINVMVNMFLASLLIEGSVSYLGYAMRLMQLPIGVLGMAVATVTLPDAAKFVSESKHKEVITSFSRSLRFVFFLTIPASVLLFVLRVPIVGLIFERGAFTVQDTIFTSQALAFFSLGIFAMSSSRVVTSIFYSYKDARTPMFLSIFTVILNIVLSLIFMKFLLFRGLALSASIASIFNLTLLLYFLQKKLKNIDGKRILKNFLKIILAAGLSGGAVFGLLFYFRGLLIFSRQLNFLIEAFGLFVVGAIIYLVFSRIFNIESVKNIWTQLKKR